MRGRDLYKETFKNLVGRKLRLRSIFDPALRHVTPSLGTNFVAVLLLFNKSSSVLSHTRQPCSDRRLHRQSYFATNGTSTLPTAPELGNQFVSSHSHSRQQGMQNCLQLALLPQRRSSSYIKEFKMYL